MCRSNEASIGISTKGLGLELVEEGEELSLRRLDDRSAVLPDSILGIESATDWIPLVLVDIVHAQTTGEGFTEDVEAAPCEMIDSRTVSAWMPVPLFHGGFQRRKFKRRRRKPSYRTFQNRIGGCKTLERM